MSQTILVVGAGQAGAQLAVSLRSEGFDGGITLIGDEAHVPYQRPPLSKHFLAGEVGIERVYVKPAEFYEKSAIELLLDNPVEALERTTKTVRLRDGSQRSYDQLALATGARVRTLDVPGSDLAGILYLRNIADMQALQQYLQPGKRLVVVGGGYIGLEVASVAINKGLHVTVLETASRLMQRTAGPELAGLYSKIHRAAGVGIHTAAQVSGFRGDGRVEQVLCHDGSEFAADVVLIGVGIVPNTELAAAAGLAVDNGIVVDQHCRSSDPDIVAAGDCTNHPCLHYAKRLRLESVPNALAQARVAAATLCGKLKDHNEVPWFWSDQYQLKLQIAGLIDGYDQVVARGDPDNPPFMLCYLKNGELIAVESVANPKEFMVARQLVAARAKIEPDRLADSSIALKDLA
jgi:3-phenylpropionate/trans-cinnamate dioxygenase ferredoxin reductase subunit